ncbi:MAG: helix-turn-helix domain-containing protein [Candidatus Aenigmatarchaeota archaeon]
MEKADIYNTLKQLGLGEYEARAYTDLVLLGPSPANELSRVANIPKSKIYDVLESLMSKQMVEVFEEKPKLFRAIDPSIAIKSLIDEKDQEFKTIKEKANALISQLKIFGKKEEIAEGIWEQNGEKATEALNKLAEMFERANKYTISITRDFSLSSILREAIKSCLRRKVKVMMICMGITKENFYGAKWCLEQKIPIKIFEAKIHPRILVVDGKEVAIRLDSNPEARRFRFRTIWSNDPSFVAVMDNYMKNLWKMAKPVDLKNFNSPSRLQI